MTSAGTMACAVCARVLSSVSTPGRYGFPGTQRWLHTPADEAADHPAVPVPVGQIRARHRCDFCSEDDPGWVLPARTFQLPGMPAGSTAAWAACDACAQLIRHNQWAALRRHVLARYQARGLMADLSPAQMSAALGRVWRHLRPQITGAPLRIHRPDGPSASGPPTSELPAPRPPD